MENNDLATTILRTYAESSRSKNESGPESCSDRWISEVLADSLRIANNEIARLRALTDELKKEREIMKTEYQRNHELITKAYEAEIKELKETIVELTPEEPGDADVYAEMISGVGYVAEVYSKEVDLAIQTFSLDKMETLLSKRQREEAAKHVLCSCGVKNPTKTMIATVRRKFTTRMSTRKQNANVDVREKKKQDERKRRLKRQRTSSETETSTVESPPPVSDDSGLFDDSREEDETEVAEKSIAAFAIQEDGQRQFRYGKVLKLYENEMRVMLYEERNELVNIAGKTDVRFVRKECLLHPNISISDGKVLEMEIVRRKFDGFV